MVERGLDVKGRASQIEFQGRLELTSNVYLPACCGDAQSCLWFRTPSTNHLMQRHADLLPNIMSDPPESVT